MPTMHQGVHHENNQKTQTATNFSITTLRPPPIPYICVVCQQPSPNEGTSTVKCRKCKNRSHKACLQPEYPSIAEARAYTCGPCARSFKEKLKADRLATSTERRDQHSQVQEMHRSHNACLQPKHPSITNAREYTCGPCARSFQEKLKADRLARSQIAGAQPIHQRPSTSKKSTFPAGDWIPRITPCAQCGKPNDHTSCHSCAQCSRKAHKACIMERKKLTKSQTFFCIACF